MPAWVKTKEEEKAWKKAIRVVEEQRGKNQASFDDSDYGLVTHISKKILKSTVMKDADNTLIYYYSKVDSLISARRKKNDEDSALEDEAADIMTALKRVMGSGGQAIAALRKVKDAGMDSQSAAELAEDLEDIADQLEDFLDGIN